MTSRYIQRIGAMVYMAGNIISLISLPQEGAVAITLKAQCIQIQGTPGFFYQKRDGGLGHISISI